MKPPKDDSKYSWTSHVFQKMQFYGISESRIRRIIRFPKRTEEGIADKTIAVMQPAGTKRYQEIWVMYKLTGNSQQKTKSKFKFNSLETFGFNSGRKMKIITAWRYPGKSPERDPVPGEILEEVRRLL